MGKAGSVSESLQRKNTEPRSDWILREWVQVRQRPMQERSDAEGLEFTLEEYVKGPTSTDRKNLASLEKILIRDANIDAKLLGGGGSVAKKDDVGLRAKAESGECFAVRGPTD